MVGAAVIAAVTAPVAVARTLDEIMASKKLIVGINPTLPPLGIFNDKNQIDGVDVDIARAIAGKMGLTLEIVQVGSPDRIPFVSSGKIDMVMGAMTWTAERAKAIDFTVPVYTEVLGVLTTKETAWTDWKELDDPKVRLVQVRGTTPVKFIAEKLPKAQVLLLDNYPDAVRAIAQDRADGMVDVLDFLTEHTKTAQGGMEDRRRRPSTSTSAASASPRATMRCARNSAASSRNSTPAASSTRRGRSGSARRCSTIRRRARSGKSLADAAGRGDVPRSGEGAGRSRRRAQDLITAPRRT